MDQADSLDDNQDHEALLQKHRKEKKELQARITALRKTATKGDKKKKKEVQEQITSMEIEMEKRHKEELAAFKDVEECREKIDDIEINDGPSMKMSKAQRRRQKKEISEKERRKLIEEEENNYNQTLRYQETEKITNKLKERGLMILNVAPDGDCMYNAIDCELLRNGFATLGVPTMRKKTSEFIIQHAEKFIPFITDPITGDLISPEGFQTYCEGIIDKSWGGQPELKALTQILKKSFIIVVSDGSDIVMGEEYRANGELILTFHNHMYELGAHYNAVKEWVDEPDTKNFEKQ